MKGLQPNKKIGVVKVEKLDKVMITVKQEKALKILKENIPNPKDAMEFFLMERQKWNGYYYHLKDIPTNDFIKILCGWYEVEQEFKVGEWAREIDLYFYGVIIGVINGEIKIKYTDNTIGWLRENDLGDRFEKVTEQWEIKLLELGREKPEFVEGDIVKLKNGRYCFLENEENIAIFHETVSKENIDRIYPIESSEKC